MLKAKTYTINTPEIFSAIQYTGDNLKEVLEFTGKHYLWDTWFTSFEEYEDYVKQDYNIFKIMGDNSNQEVYPSDWVVSIGTFYFAYPDVIFNKLFTEVE